MRPEAAITPFGSRRPPGCFKLSKINQPLGLSNHHWRVAHWILVLCPAVASLLPWIGQLEWRFSLRTLLIATTLIAVVLGLIVSLR